ncbi:hypothetical protein HZB00_02120 [Candidatus Woesearchaeota archaeon]|nr:hypothetical protein [Candidatus Woesearchaeota archaeon]
MATFIIEHAEKKLSQWCVIEYRQMSKYVGKQNLFFTNILKKDVKKLKPYGSVETRSMTQLQLQKVCILDPNTKKTLTPEDAKQFDYFVFGGILGDAPARGRTKTVLTDKMKNVEARNLTGKQMSTDTAVLVAKMIADGTPVEKIQFQDTIEITLKKGKIQESVILPYRYVLENGKPKISRELITYLAKKQDL